MRGIETNVSIVRRKVFCEVAKLAYEYNGENIKDLDKIAYRIIPGEEAIARDSIFLEREIISEKLRLAMGLPLRDISEHSLPSDGAEECVNPNVYYQPPLMNVIKFACNKCPDNVVKVTDLCRNCIAHPCRQVCPKGAMTLKDGKSFVNQKDCIKCGKCIEACPYHAIVKQVRPCASACGMGAISSDEYGRSQIDPKKCVSCGQCLVSCPFGAISDKSQIFQCIQAMKSGVPVVAEMAPSIVGQFGEGFTDEKIRNALKMIGFSHVIETAIGADICAVDETKKFIEEVPGKMPYMLTSCCPAWRKMIAINYPECKDKISLALTPMALTAKFIKRKHPECKICFIGPCTAKKLEAMDPDIRSDVDFVITYEEVKGMLDAKNISAENVEDDVYQKGASGDARGFAVSGGVAKAVQNTIDELYPDTVLHAEIVEGLANCRKTVALAKAGKYDGYIIEGMACPGGCIAGPGTIQPIQRSKANIEKQIQSSKRAHCYESKYAELAEQLENLEL